MIFNNPLLRKTPEAFQFINMRLPMTKSLPMINSQMSVATKHKRIITSKMYIHPYWSGGLMRTKRENEKSFGTKMKEIRQLKRISFKDLANKTGFSQRYLEEIEDGIAIPPVGAVIQIAKALTINSGLFLSAGKQKAVEKRKKESIYKHTQAYSYKTLTPHAEKKHMKAFLVTINPKQTHKMVEYRHEGEEFIYVLKGHIELIIGENPNILNKDETLHFDSGIPHRLRNVGDNGAELLITILTH